MTSKNRLALAMTGLALLGAFSVTTAFAGPPKKPVKKPSIHDHEEDKYATFDEYYM